MLLYIARLIRNIGAFLAGGVFVGILAFLGINFAIIQGAKNKIVQAPHLQEQLPAIIVLGASVEGLQLSPILQDRVETAIQLYEDKKTKKIIVSGDSGKKYYNEVDAMYKYLRNRGIPEDAIIIDTGGKNTFASLQNIKLIDEHYGFDKVGIVTQNFHLPRALFIAQSLQIDSIGIVSDRAAYEKEKTYRLRETLARIKALFDIIFYYIS